MKRIIENKKDEIVINKSKFIGFVFYVASLDEANNKIQELKKEYSDASHLCYAYVIGNNKRFTDDKEPVGGLPILNILEGNELNNVLCVVVRYFGGIKLGVGGLSRAYAQACKIVVDNNIKEIEPGYKVKITFSYENTNSMTYLLDNASIINKDFNDLVVFDFLITREEYKKIEEKLKLLCEIKEKEEILI